MLQPPLRRMRSIAALVACVAAGTAGGAFAQGMDGVPPVQPQSAGGQEESLRPPPSAESPSRSQQVANQVQSGFEWQWIRFKLHWLTPIVEAAESGASLTGYTPDFVASARREYDRLHARQQELVRAMDAQSPFTELAEDAIAGAADRAGDVADQAPYAFEGVWIGVRLNWLRQFLALGEAGASLSGYTPAFVAGARREYDRLQNRRQQLERILAGQPQIAAGNAAQPAGQGLREYPPPAFAWDTRIRTYGIECFGGQHLPVYIDHFHLNGQFVGVERREYDRVRGEAIAAGLQFCGAWETSRETSPR